MKAETTSILAKLEILQEEAERHDSKGEEKEELEKYNLIIKIGTEALSKYSNFKSFYFRVSNMLEEIHYSRGLGYRYKNCKKAIKDFEKCRFYNEKIKRPDTPALKQCLLECYIIEKQYKKGLEIVQNIRSINKEEFDGSKYSPLRQNYLKLLEEANDETAKALYQRLQEIIVD